ncbi:hypothetical protein QFZ66_005998 [Streptomyces sp. B4I13]|nr:hypothetical protein [Streptomyces sp. B4I13]
MTLPAAVPASGSGSESGSGPRGCPGEYGCGTERISHAVTRFGVALGERHRPAPIGIRPEESRTMPFGSYSHAPSRVRSRAAR